METKEGVLRKFIRQPHRLQWLIKTNRNKLSGSFTFNFISRFIDDVSLLNNSKFGNFVDPEKEQNGTHRISST
jgi:hypothetical protein